MAPPRTTEAEFVRLYRGFLRLYPAEFRDEYGRELCLVFQDRCREESSRQSLWRVWFQAVSGILTEAPREHYAKRVRRVETSKKSWRSIEAPEGRSPYRPQPPPLLAGSALPLN
jgi:hypothetical protein